MRGADEASGSLFSYVDIEARIPARHPLRQIRRIVNDVLVVLDGEFEGLYAVVGRPSIPPERLIRASLLQILFSVRGQLKGICRPPSVVHHALLRWYRTPGGQPRVETDEVGLIADPRLHARRAPGNTCLSALAGSTGFGELARNDSKGCGTIMRVAPVALMAPRAQVHDLAIETSALTVMPISAKRPSMAGATPHARCNARHDLGAPAGGAVLMAHNHPDRAERVPQRACGLLPGDFL